MNNQSKIVQINEYLLLEYEYNSNNYLLEDTGGLLIKDNRVGWNYFLNGNQSGAITKNVLDNSCLRLNSNSWVATDIDVPTQWINYDTNMIVSSLSSYGRNIKYDRIKLHVLSGYNLENIEGLIFELALTDNNNSTLLLSSQLISKQNWNVFINNKRPIFMGDRYYDKYISWEIPSVKDLNTEWAETNGSNIGVLSQLTNNYGIKDNSLLDIAIHECLVKRTENSSFDIYESGKVWRTSINQEDTYHLFSCVLEESTLGDFYEFYPTYNDSNISEWINEMRNLGGDWIVIHDISVWEQIENDEIITSKTSSYQESNFEEPHIFRPVIISENAFSYTIEYVCRIFNRKDSSQIIRKASLSSTNTKKYGRNLNKIEINGDLHKIYNKVVESNPIKLNPIKEITKVQNIYFPIFIDKQNIVTSGEKVWILNGDIQSTPSEFSETVWPQGELKIFLNPFDNYIKFKIYENN